MIEIVTKMKLFVGKKQKDTHIFCKKRRAPASHTYSLCCHACNGCHVPHLVVVSRPLSCSNGVVTADYLFHLGEHKICYNLLISNRTEISF